MATKIRSSDGCWTCRLRRKKCGEEKPVCSTCAILEVDCLYSDTKPDWMDGAERQKEKTAWLKAEIRSRAGSRRDRRYLEAIEAGMGDLEMEPATDDADDADDTMAQDSDDATVPGNSLSSATPSSCASSTAPSSHTPYTVLDPQSERLWHQMADYILPPEVALSARASQVSNAIVSISFEERELSMAMMYLDHVFPFLFPFYRPPFLDSGRSWLLVLLSRNKALFHAALSLASHFFSVFMTQSNTKQNLCQRHGAEELHMQQNLALHELNKDMCSINMRGVQGHLLDATRVVASIVQLMTFEVAAANTDHWQIHLGAASELFGQILSQGDPTDDPRVPSWTVVLLQLMGKSRESLASLDELYLTIPWNPDQAAFRFFSVTLLFTDVLGSTALEQPPRLQRWHEMLLGSAAEGAQSAEPTNKYTCLPRLDLVQFIGLQNWAIVAIGEIAALAAWKKEMKKANSLSMTQLVTRAMAIESALRAGMLSLDPAAGAPTGVPDYNTPLHFHPDQTHLMFPVAMPGASASMTRIWAQTALTYLNVVVSGWQPANPEIHASVEETLSQLLALCYPQCLRVLVWPFCVTACLAGEEHEEEIRNLAARVGPLAVFGSLQEAVKIIEHVWAHRREIAENADAWGVAECLRSLGYASLLM